MYAIATNAPCSLSRKRLNHERIEPLIILRPLIFHLQPLSCMPANARLTRRAQQLGTTGFSPTMPVVVACITDKDERPMRPKGFGSFYAPHALAELVALGARPHTTQAEGGGEESTTPVGTTATGSITTDTAPPVNPTDTGAVLKPLTTRAPTTVHASGQPWVCKHEANCPRGTTPHVHTGARGEGGDGGDAPSAAGARSDATAHTAGGGRQTYFTHEHGHRWPVVLDITVPHAERLAKRVVASELYEIIADADTLEGLQVAAKANKAWAQRLADLPSCQVIWHRWAAPRGGKPSHAFTQLSKKRLREAVRSLAEGVPLAARRVRVNGTEAAAETFCIMCIDDDGGRMAAANARMPGASNAARARTRATRACHFYLARELGRGHLPHTCHRLRIGARGDSGALTPIKPTLAILMANLAGVATGEVALDPYCGSGSLLLGAAHLGATCFGCDITYKDLGALDAQFRYHAPPFAAIGTFCVDTYTCAGWRLV